MRSAPADLEHEAEACRALWASVVHRLLLDAAHDTGDGEAARAWLKRPDHQVLDLRRPVSRRRASGAAAVPARLAEGQGAQAGAAVATAPPWHPAGTLRDDIGGRYDYFPPSGYGTALGLFLP